MTDATQHAQPVREGQHKPLRFEDVRTGDLITVEHKGNDGFWYTAGGTAVVDDLGVTLSDGFEFLFTKDDRDGWIDGVGDKVTLIAHIPAPEWYRAKVIKADADYRDSDPEKGRLSTQRHGGVFLASTRVPGEFLDQSGNELTPDAFTNVTIIIDEHGQVRG